MELAADNVIHELKQKLDDLMGAARLYETLWLVEADLISPVEACRLLYGSEELAPDQAAGRIRIVRDGLIDRRLKTAVAASQVSGVRSQESGR